MESTTGHTTTILNKIIIPVITTVLGATAIYFLGFNKKTSASAAEIEKATVNAWQSFVSTHNIYYKVVKSVSEEYTEKVKTAYQEKGLTGVMPVFREMKNELSRETKKLKDDINEIIKKSDDIDAGFVSMMKRSIDNINGEEEKVETFLADISSLVKSDLGEQEKAEKFKKEAEKFQAMEEKATERQAMEAEDIATALSKKYNRPFDLNELIVYVEYKKEKEGKKTDPNINVTNNPINDPGGQAPADPNAILEPKDNSQDNNENTSPNNKVEPSTSLLTGNWVMTGGELTLSGNGEMYWSFGNKGYTSGNWKLVDGKINMNATNPDTKKTTLIIGHISNFNRNSFTLTFMTTPREVYNFTKKNN